MKLAAFCVVTQCNLAEVYQRFIALLFEAATTSEKSVKFYQTTRATTQKAAKFIFAAVRT
jgi:hypothetical protein